jgi:hypothetical protein
VIKPVGAILLAQNDYWTVAERLYAMRNRRSS